MTAEQILKLDNIQYPETDLAWRRESYDAGHPECKCSACGQKVKADEEFENEPGFEIGCCEAQDKNHPVRLWRGEGKAMQEAVLHLECFQYLHNQKGLFRDSGANPDLMTDFHDNF